MAQILSGALVASLSPQQNPIFVELTPDWRVLGFPAGLAILTCIRLGWRLDSVSQLAKRSAESLTRGTTAGRNHFLMRRTFVISRVACSLLYCYCCFLFRAQLPKHREFKSAFQQDHILIADLSSSLKLMAESQMVFKQELLSRMQAIPGVRCAAEVQMVPLSQSE